MDNQTSPNHVKRHRIMWGLIILLILAGIAAAIIWSIFYRNYQTTEDAYVGGNILVLSSRQDGSVTSCYVESADFVREGEILVALDPTDYLGNVELKKAALAKAARNVGTLYEDVEQKKASVKLEQAKYNRATLNYENRKPLKETEAIPQEEIENAEADFKVQKASLEFALSQLESSKVALGQTKLKEHPDIQKAKVELIDALIALSRCTIRAPSSGYIANKNVQIGQTIKAGTPLLNIVPLSPLWVDANFKETQLENIRVGQPVTLISDIYGQELIFHGRIEGLLPGSGSTFSLLPTQNATGNWIKIVQRVGVRISLDPEQIKKYPLVLGLSMTVSVDISDTTGVPLSQKPLQQFANTKIFDLNVAEYHPMIDQIINDNLQIHSE